MTDASMVFRRLGSMGWLALAGSPPQLNQAGVQISERLLEIADLSRPPLIFNPERSLRPDLKLFIDDLEILLGNEIQNVHPDELEEAELREQWLNAGIMIMGGGSQAYWRELIGMRLFQTEPQEILAEGALLFVFGACASLMGAWTFNQRLHELEQGLGWVMGSIVLPTNSDPAEISAVRNYLNDHEDIVALGLPDGALLALGPDDQVEVWTEKAPVLLLGKGWQQ
jgi:hypothetical protein